MAQATLVCWSFLGATQLEKLSLCVYVYTLNPSSQMKGVSDSNYNVESSLLNYSLPISFEKSNKNKADVGFFTEHFSTCHKFATQGRRGEEKSLC